MDESVMTGRPVKSEDFNKYNPVVLFSGPVMTMYPVITLKELKTLIDRAEDVVMVNVSQRAEFEAGHICASINIPVEDIERCAPILLKKDDLIIVYSRDERCGASAVGADKLSTIGFEAIMRFRGGVKEWREAGYCIEGAQPEVKKAA